MEQVKLHRNILFSLALLVFALLYALTIPALIAGISGIQAVPLGTSTQELLALCLVALIGGIGIVGIFLWKRWGVFLLFTSWILTFFLNFMISSLVATTVSSGFILLAFILGFEIGRSWKQFV